MKFAVLAFMFGSSFFVLGAAALAPEREGSSGSLWLLMLILAVLHDTIGFLAIGGARAYAAKRWKVVGGCVAASTAVTLVSVLAAIFLAFRAQIMVPVFVAILFAAATSLAGIATIARIDWRSGFRGRITLRLRHD